MSRTQRGRPVRERLARAAKPKAPRREPAAQPAKPAFPKMTRQALIVRLLITAVGLAYIAKVVIDGYAAQHR